MQLLMAGRVTLMKGCEGDPDKGRKGETNGRKVQDGVRFETPV